MSGDDLRPDDLLRQLSRELPYEAPSEARREAVRASLLAQVEVAQVRAADPSARPAWRTPIAFVAGALAAAAVAVVVVQARGGGAGSSTGAATGAAAPSAGDAVAPVAHADIAASPGAELEHTTKRTAAGDDEVVRVHAGHVRLAVAGLGAGDHVRVLTGNAEVAGTGVYELTVDHERLRELTVHSGGAMVAVTGSTAVFLAAGQTWRAPVETAAVELPAPAALAPAPLAPPVRSTTMTPPASIAGVHADTGVRTIVGPAPTRAVASSTVSPRAPHHDAPAQPRLETARLEVGMTPAAPTAVIERSPAPATPSPVPPAPTAAQPQPAAPQLVAPAPPKTTVAEQQFARGWAAFRANDFERAATELAAAADAGEARGETIAFDARYQEAVALARAGHAAEAERAISQFLARAGDTPRRGRAELLLGRLLAARHEIPRALEELQLAAHDADPGVVAAATAELAKLR